MSNNVAEEKVGPSTKDKLASIVDGFSNFDTEMKIGTRQRREKDEFRIAELKMEMKRLDAGLTAEIKKRTEMNKSTQTWIENELSKLPPTRNPTLQVCQHSKLMLLAVRKLTHFWQIMGGGSLVIYLCMEYACIHMHTYKHIKQYVYIYTHIYLHVYCTYIHPFICLHTSGCLLCV